MTRLEVANFALSLPIYWQEPEVEGGRESTVVRFECKAHGIPQEVVLSVAMTYGELASKHNIVDYYDTVVSNKVTYLDVCLVGNTSRDDVFEFIRLFVKDTSGHHIRSRLYHPAFLG